MRVWSYVRSSAAPCRDGELAAGQPLDRACVCHLHTLVAVKASQSLCTLLVLGRGGGVAAGQPPDRGVQLPKKQGLRAPVLPVPHHRKPGQNAQNAQDGGNAGGCDELLPQRAVFGGC